MQGRHILAASGNTPLLELLRKFANAVSKWLCAPIFRIRSCSPIECAAACASVDMVSAAGLAGLTSRTITFAAGTNSCRISRSFGTS